MVSTTPRTRIIKAGAIAFWLAVWEIASLLIGEELFLPPPISVLEALVASAVDLSFWSAVLFTIERIILGFIISLSSAVILAFLSYRWRILGILLEPIVKVVRATPVASIVILILVWVRSRNLSVVISFMMVFPVVYQNVLKGLCDTDRNLIEMADAYRIRTLKRIRYIYLPYLVPYLESAISISLGLAWKSGIAAEVIAIPDGSIGEKLYEAKLYLATADLFAWTVAIIILAKVFEKVLLFIVRKALAHMEVS